MATKNNPGKYDCYANAEPDEPLFVLLARDQDAPALVEAWADAREQRGEKPEKIAEARQCAQAMRTWRRENRPTEAELRESALESRKPGAAKLAYLLDTLLAPTSSEGWDQADRAEIRKTIG